MGHFLLFEFWQNSANTAITLKCEALFKLKNNKMIFESNNITKSIVVLALPTIISQLITTVYNLADTFWVGRLNDPYQMAALSLVFPTQLIMTALGNLFGIGAGTCISSCLGAKNFQNAKFASSFAVWYGCFSALLFSLFALFFRSPFLSMLGSTSVLDGYAGVYLDWVVVLGAVPSVFNMIIANTIRGEGLSLQAGIGLSLGGILNIFLDPVFVLPFGFNMQIEGAAIATFISNIITTIYFIIILILKRKTSVISLYPMLIRSLKAMGQNVIFTGIPSALQTLLSAVSNLVLNSLMIGYGEFAEAAVGIIKKIDAIPFGAITGLAQGAAPLIAYNCGAKNEIKMRKTLSISMRYCIFMALIVLTLIEIFADPIILTFISDSQTVIYGSSFLRLHCISMPFMAITFMLVSFFQAVGAKTRAFILSIIRKGIIDIPMMFFINSVFPMYGIIMCQPITDFISAFCGILLFYFWNRSFKSKQRRIN